MTSEYADEDAGILAASQMVSETFVVIGVVVFPFLFAILFLSDFRKVETRIVITREEAEWVEVLAQGWSDLQGFMTEKQYLRSLHYQEPPVPIVLSCDFPFEPDAKKANKPWITVRLQFRIRARVECGKIFIGQRHDR